jgi:hypothetical protein
VSEQAHDPESQVKLAYRLAVARPATDEEVAVGADVIRKQSLAALAHVVLNLNEFLYMR